MSSASEKKISDGIAGLVVAVSLTLLWAYAIMLGLGVVHNDISRTVPALGYWPVVLLIWAINCARHVLFTRAKSTTMFHVLSQNR